MRPLLRLLAVAALTTVVAACRGRTIEAHPDELAGVGIVLREEPGTHALVVEKVFPSGPAAGAGLREGDKVKAIDGGSTEGQSLASVVERLRGPVGTEVSLTVDEGPSGAALYIVRRQQLKKAGDKGYEAK